MAMATIGFHVIKHSTVSVAHAILQGFLVFIHTLKHGAMMVMTNKRCHDVSIVLPGPGGRAASLGWDHNYSGSSGHITHGTRHIVVVCSLSRFLILCPIHIGMSLHPTSVCEGGAVFWVYGHTQVIGSTSCLGVKGSSSDARVE